MEKVLEPRGQTAVFRIVKLGEADHFNLMLKGISLSEYVV